MKQERLSAKNTAFFSTANDSYIPKAATSLLLIRQFIPNAQLYILSRHISKKNKVLLNRHKIKYVELDLTYLFFQTWQYPIECYYLFAGPEIFEKLKFKYSVYIDGDILCLKNPLKNCPPIQNIGGVKANTFDELFYSEKNTIIERFNLSPHLFSEYRLQSGVIYMNNKALTKMDFLDQCGKIYHDSWKNGCPRKGDDSLFALFQLINHAKLSVTILEDDFNYIPHFKDFSTNDSITFFHFTLDKPWKLHPYQHTNKRQNAFNPFVKTWRQSFRHNFHQEWIKSLSFPANLIRTIKRIKKIFFQIPFVLNGTRYSIIKKRHNLKKPPLLLYWWEPKHINNFGDIVSQDIILNILGRGVKWSPIEACELIATGSIIEVAQQANRNEQLYCWGSGFIKSNSKNENLDKIIFTAVRGRKTLARINKNIPTGDPGLLINATYALKKKRHSKKIGVIIHYADIKTDLTKKFCQDNRFEVITPLDSPENVARKISNCSLILSSSLHGLIFADSLSVPNFHIKISNNLTGGTYKFIDYYSGVGKDYEPADLSKIFDNEYLLYLRKSYKPIAKLTKKQHALIKAFPFN